MRKKPNSHVQSLKFKTKLAHPLLWSVEWPPAPQNSRNSRGLLAGATFSSLCWRLETACSFLGVLLSLTWEYSGLGGPIDPKDHVDSGGTPVSKQKSGQMSGIRSILSESWAVIQELPNGPTTTTTTTVEVQIHSVVLKVKHVFPNDEIKLQLMQPIKNDTPILIPFRKWDLSQLPALTNGAKSEIWAVKTSASVERPRYVIVCFQKSKRDNAEADATHFDNTSIVSIRLALNGEYWPNERMQLDFAKQDYTLAYYNYTRFYSSYSHSTEVHPILDYGEFKQHALFVIDCSRQEETMKSSTVDIKLEIEADKGFPADTKAYCIIVHDCLLEYFPLTEVVRTLI
ncbi:unnamed protein product [Phaedon cochleariae]|uniref:Double jelly roll-like domain-containing protein n=1 Tax=Phaedon cochleariae TaxID=80249 RepID=A0A9N9WZN8_PHACE|nr:unnamed protein product [Phaedon cochleariae]